MKSKNQDLANLPLNLMQSFVHESLQKQQYNCS